MKPLYSRLFYLVLYLSVSTAAYPKESSAEDAQSIADLSMYCECSFYDSASTKQKIFVGWLVGEWKDTEQQPLVRINSKKHMNFVMRYERFSQVLDSYSEFLLIDGKDTIKGKLNTTQNCDDAEEFCEHIGFKGSAEVTIKDISTKYSIIGGCGC
ncbi:MAG: hypothetical protein V7731_15440 [Amphritea sp.]